MSVNNFKSAKVLIGFLDDGGFLSGVNDAQCSQLLTLAAAIDLSPDNAALHREFRAVEEGLRSLSGADVDEYLRLLGEFTSGS